MASIKCQAALTESEELGTDWAENCIRAGEGLVYANEMLEDDDEDVVKEVRRWVLSVNEMLGEDILEA
jgi:U3 small nucleolar RNA-associated protein 10